MIEARLAKYPKVTFINRLMGICRGGGENADLYFARSLRSLGCEVQFIVGRSWRAVDRLLDEFPTKYTRTPYLRGLHYRWSDSLFPVMRRMASVAQRIDLEIFERAVLRQVTGDGFEQTDVYQICGLPRLGAWIRQRTGRPVIVRWPGPPPAAWCKWVRECSATFAGGDALMEARESMGPQVREVNVGVDTKRFQPRARKGFWQRKGVSDDAVVVLFVGRFIPVKNLSMLLKGFADAALRQRNLVLALVGDGEAAPVLRQQARQLTAEDRVLFTGLLSGDALSAAYAEADIFAITSLYDNFPNVVLEAMASGLPVVGTRVGGIPLQIEDGVNGLLVESGDVHGLSEALLQLSNDPECCCRMGTVNRRKVAREYSWDESGGKLLTLYQEILGETTSVER
jgi:glycosyltransferase involved in cell wall biosynthesis